MPEGSAEQVSTAAVPGQSAMPADGVLLEAARLGDNAAFETLFERYYAQVYAVSLRVLGSPEDAEELTLDVFLKLHQRPVQRLEDGALGGWLYRTTLNAAFNSLRSRKRRFGWWQRLATLHRGAASGGDDPQDLLERDSDIATIRNALATLPEKQRNALVLRSHGFHYREIAGALELSPSSVGTTLARGERALRRQLENEVEL